MLTTAPTRTIAGWLLPTLPIYRIFGGHARLDVPAAAMGIPTNGM